MKRKSIWKMMLALTICGSMTAMTAMPVVRATGDETPNRYPILKDENGNVYDLGGMEIVIRDWWTDPEEELDMNDEYIKAREEWHEWIQETYNFKIVQKMVSEWGDVPQDFVDYVAAGGDDVNYAFILREDGDFNQAVYEGMCFNLATLDCLDFSSEKFTVNNVHQKYGFGNKIYAMYAGNCEPRGGVFFNKRILQEAGIDPDSLYDMQRDGTWTWDKLVELLDIVQRDTDGDGDIDIYGANCNNGILPEIAVYSNGGEFVTRASDGKIIYQLEDEKTLEGLDYAQKIFDNYWEKEDVIWDQYKQSFIDGRIAFMFEEAWAGTGYLEDMEEEYGFVMFPKGPKADDYIGRWSNNPVCIPSCYDIDRAWNIAFAWNLYTDEVPGYENKDGWKSDYKEGFDERALNETLAMMRVKGKEPSLEMVVDASSGEDLFWRMGPGEDMSEVVAEVGETWKNGIEATNLRIDELLKLIDEWDKMYRLYNPNSGEHFYTAMIGERDFLVSVGWNSESWAWRAPISSGIPVFRLYNPNAGDHHYTTNAAERDMLISVGWNDEGVGWYSDEKEGVPMYRLYNPNATAGSHHYTANAAERDYLVSLGWQDEGIGWYGRK